MTEPPAITEGAIKRRVFSEVVNRRLRETTLLRVLPGYLKGDVAVDVGAATGHITYFLKDYYPQVWAFEAVSLVYQQLIKMEDYAGVHCIHAAVSDYDGYGKIYIDHKRLSNSGFQDLVGGPSVEVPVIKLDDFLPQIDGEVGFIKIDVEGTEFDVLKGAEGIIDRQKPTLMVEIYEPYSAYPLVTIFRWLMEKGYKCGYYSHPNLVEVKTPEEGVGAVMTKHKEHDGDFLFWA